MPNPNARDIKAVARATAEPAAAGALGALVHRGCDRDELLRLLARLRHADVARRRVTKHLKRLARTLDEAAAGVADLPAWRESGNLGLPDDAKTWLLGCSHDLQLLADAIRLRLTEADPVPGGSPIDKAREKIVRYVGAFAGHAIAHDGEVGVLIDAVLRVNAVARTSVR
jgi:hypothetical protein